MLLTFAEFLIAKSTIYVRGHSCVKRAVSTVRRWARSLTVASFADVSWPRVEAAAEGHDLVCLHVNGLLPVVECTDQSWCTNRAGILDFFKAFRKHGIDDICFLYNPYRSLMDPWHPFHGTMTDFAYFLGIWHQNLWSYTRIRMTQVTGSQMGKHLPGGGFHNRFFHRIHDNLFRCPTGSFLAFIAM